MLMNKEDVPCSCSKNLEGMLQPEDDIYIALAAVMGCCNNPRDGMLDFSCIFAVPSSTNEYFKHSALLI